MQNRLSSAFFVLFYYNTNLYNIVDQIFIANASYLGSYGNAANTVVFPLTVVALAIAVMIGDGCCAFCQYQPWTERGPQRQSGASAMRW